MATPLLGEISDAEALMQSAKVLAACERYKNNENTFLNQLDCEKIKGKRAFVELGFLSWFSFQYHGVQ